MDNIKEFLENYKFELAVFSGYILRKHHIYRQINKVFLPSLALILLYRSSKSTNLDETILKFILDKFISSIKNKHIEFILLDIAGVILTLSFYDKLDSFMFGEKLLDKAFDYVKNLPFIKSYMFQETSRFKHDFEKMKAPARAIDCTLTVLPDNGRARDEVLALMEALTTSEDQKWINGKVSGAVYLGDQV
jgi:hypothetical protein